MCFSIHVILTMDYRYDYKQLHPLLRDLGYSDVFICSYGLHTYFNRSPVQCIMGLLYIWNRG